MTGFDYKVIHNELNHRFEVELPGDKAVLIYTLKSDLFLIIHTEVPPAYEGRGIAGTMAKTALEFALEKGYLVRSYCSYTTHYIDSHPEYQAMLG